MPLDLGEAIGAIYDEVVYKLSIDYRQSSPPTLSEVDRHWVDDLLSKIR